MDGGQGQGKEMMGGRAWNAMCFDQYVFSYYIPTVAYRNFKYNFDAHHYLILAWIELDSLLTSTWE